jgi:PTH1 family peptidyl-tRNA hydrolase
MKLVVGLGNPGVEYEKSRHNVGFVVLDRLARRHAPAAIARSRFHGLMIDVQPSESADARLLLLKPMTYMNRSGTAIAEALRFYKMDPGSDLLVIVDDVALPCGTIRVRASGSAGGHNGLTDIEQRLGTDQYARLRIGIDSPTDIPQREYVLGRFRPDQLEAIEPALDRAVDAAICWATEGIKPAMNQFNQKAAQQSVNADDDPSPTAVSNSEK